MVHYALYICWGYCNISHLRKSIGQIVMGAGKWSISIFDQEPFTRWKIQSGKCIFISLRRYFQSQVKFLPWLKAKAHLCFLPCSQIFLSHIKTAPSVLSSVIGLICKGCTILQKLLQIHSFLFVFYRRNFPTSPTFSYLSLSLPIHLWSHPVYGSELNWEMLCRSFWFSRIA